MRCPASLCPGRRSTRSLSPPFRHQPDGVLDGGRREAIDRHCQELWQGDVLTVPVFAVLGSPASTADQETADAARENGDGVVSVQREAITKRWAILTQSCDLRKA